MLAARWLLPAFWIIAVVLLGLAATSTEQQLDHGPAWRTLGGLAIQPHRGCRMCGMTHSFICMAHRQYARAAAHNAAGPALYTACWLYVFIVAGLALTRRWPWSQSGRSHNDRQEDRRL